MAGFHSCRCKIFGSPLDEGRWDVGGVCRYFQGRRRQGRRNHQEVFLSDEQGLTIIGDQLNMRRSGKEMKCNSFSF